MNNIISINSEEATKYMEDLKAEAKFARSTGLNTTADVLMWYYTRFCTLLSHGKN